MAGTPAPPSRLSVTLDSPLPASIPAGGAVALFWMGSASEDGGPVGGMDLVVDGVAHSPGASRMPRFQAACRRSGFWGLVPLRADRAAGTIVLAAEVRRRDGSAERVALGEIEIAAEAPSAARPPAAASAAATGTPAPARTRSRTALIAICMATFDPDSALLRAQIESIRAQSDAAWVCVISDDHSSEERYRELCSLVAGDERFVVSRSESRIGFYRNFERAMRLAPAQAELIALCDQDDVWHPDKLSVLRASLGSAALVYSDQRLVDARGAVLRDTLWRGRRNNTTNLASMMIANSVTGASALFTRETAELALPFPDSPGIEFHDHWIALVALASGKLAYVDRPLYDYVQHRGAILGKVAGRRPGVAARRGRPRLPAMLEWRSAYFLGVVPAQVRSQTLLLRCEDRLEPAKRRALQRYLTLDTSLLSAAWFVMRPMRALTGHTETLGTEWELALGVLWRRLAGLAAGSRWLERWALDATFPDPPRFEHRRLRRWRERVLS